MTNKNKYPVDNRDKTQKFKVNNATTVFQEFIKRFITSLLNILESLSL